MPTRYHEHFTEQDHMIRDLAKEHDVPHPIFPDTAREGRPVAWGEKENNRRALEWRRKLIAELEARPEWVREWRVAQDLDRRIEELCEQKGLHFMPHECPPWDAPDELPEGHKVSDWGWNNSLPQAVKLRRKLIAEIEAEV